MPKRVVVIQESDSGRNQQFKDNLKNKTMSRSEFVKEIEKGNYQNYHVRVINGVKTPVSNPDNSTNNNLN
jgi:hypothetical protein